MVPQHLPTDKLLIPPRLQAWDVIFSSRDCKRGGRHTG
jgi:hypothetical protein